MFIGEEIKRLLLFDLLEDVNGKNLFRKPGVVMRMIENRNKWNRSLSHCTNIVASNQINIVAKY